MTRLIIIGTFIFISNIYSQSKVSDVYALSKIYGYLRYFYPSSEVDNLDWNRFLIYSLKHLNDEKFVSLNKKMSSTFSCIASGIKFSKQNINSSLIEKEIYPSDTLVFNYKFLRNKLKLKYSLKTFENDIANNYLKRGECINLKILKNLYCYMPLVLYANQSGTYPKVDKDKFEAFQLKFNTSNISDSSIYNRLAGVIILWNTIQHYYPYRDVLPSDWDRELMKSLSACYETKNVDDYLKLLNHLLSQINDGHAFAYIKNGKSSNFPSFKWDYINDSLIISNVHDTLKNKLSAGDIVLAVDGIEVNNLIKQKRKETSSATKSYSDYISARSILRSNKNRWLNLQIQKPSGEVKKIDIYRGLKYVDYSKAFINPNPQSMPINDSTYYINFHIATQKYIDSLLPVVLNKNIICDLRSYPNGNDGFLSHLLTADDTVQHHFKILEVLLPDFKHVNYKSGGWQLKKKEPHLTGRIVFLIDNSIISYGESFMALVEHYHLGTIIGEHTAGTNGNVASVNLPVADISFSYTGLYVTKPNGSSLHGIGILPDIEVKPIIQGIRNGKDEILERAISFLNVPMPK